MGEDDGPEAVGKGVEEAPEEAADSRRGDEHGVEGREVDGGVEGGGEEEADKRVAFFHEAALDEAAPEDLLGGADPEDQQEGDEPVGHGGTDGVDAVDLSGSEGQEERGEGVAEIEDGVEDAGGEKAEGQVDPLEAELGGEVFAVGDEGAGGEQTGGEDHGGPEGQGAGHGREEHGRPEEEGERQQEGQGLHTKAPSRQEAISRTPKARWSWAVWTSRAAIWAGSRPS